MSSRKYRTYKFIYDDDFGNSSIKLQKSLIDPETQDTYTPITSLFAVRVIDSKYKSEGTSKNLRHLLVKVKTGKYKVNLPYAVNTTTLKQHIKEILKTERVLCGSYQGESKILK